MLQFLLSSRSGGVEVYAQQGKIKVTNTLDKRLDLISQQVSIFFFSSPRSELVHRLTTSAFLFSLFHRCYLNWERFSLAETQIVASWTKKCVSSGTDNNSKRGTGQPICDGAIQHQISRRGWSTTSFPAIADQILLSSFSFCLHY